MLPSVILVVAAQILGSMVLMIVATALCGGAAGLGYRGSLQVVNQIAPEDRRSEVVSSYFVCVFCGNAIPVVGIGVISTLANSTMASLIFAVMIVVFAVVALLFGMSSPYRRRCVRAYCRSRLFTELGLFRAGCPGATALLARQLAKGRIAGKLDCIEDSQATLPPPTPLPLRGEVICTGPS
jgi:MFS family permease